MGEIEITKDSNYYNRELKRSVCKINPTNVILLLKMWDDFKSVYLLIKGSIYGNLQIQWLLSEAGSDNAFLHLYLLFVSHSTMLVFKDACVRAWDASEWG